VITIGIDPHKSSLTAVALQPSGEIAATIRPEVTSDTVARLRAWAIRWTQRQWAVEGAAGLGRGVAQGLLAQANRSWMCPPSWPPGPAAQHRPCP
jgi:transposase